MVGQSDLTGDMAFHASWQDGGMTDLGTLPGDVVSWAETINNQGEAAGTSFDATDFPHPFVWQSGVMTNLNNLIPPNSPWLLLEALGNNDRGQIIGYGYRTDIGEVHAYVATPCDGAHPGIEGCDYSMAEASQADSLPAVSQLSPNLRSTIKEMLPHRPGRWTGFGSRRTGAGRSLQTGTFGGPRAIAQQ